MAGGRPRRLGEVRKVKSDFGEQPRRHEEEASMQNEEVRSHKCRRVGRTHRGTALQAARCAASAACGRGKVRWCAPSGGCAACTSARKTALQAMLRIADWQSRNAGRTPRPGLTAVLCATAVLIRSQLALFLCREVKNGLR